MKWNRFTIKTKTEAEDMIICTLAEIGVEGAGDSGSPAADRGRQGPDVCGYHAGRPSRMTVSLT